MSLRAIFCNQKFAFTMALGVWWGILCTYYGHPWWFSGAGGYVIGRYIGWRIFR